MRKAYTTALVVTSISLLAACGVNDNDNNFIEPEGVNYNQVNYEDHDMGQNDYFTPGRGYDAGDNHNRNGHGRHPRLTDDRGDMYLNHESRAQR
ncbi:hypothetical protein ACFSCX_25445 [Bacillus salitolerans]|uniref:Lipoprotein n=1 Tax=Bacillus salitolerans TaxID=1437434 RepID=A0ABW4LY74_9BACI